METILIFLLVIVAIALIALVLLQHGKGADVGAAFGSGASNTVFGSQGSGSFLMKLTLGLAAVFFVICIVLARLAVMDVQGQQTVVVPNAPAQQQAPAPGSNSNVPAVPQS